MPVVEIYTKTFCSFCWRAKGLLESKGVAFKEISVDFGGAEKARMVERAGGRTTVPQIFIHGEPIGGYTDMRDLDNRGVLDRMIAANENRQGSSASKSSARTVMARSRVASVAVSAVERIFSSTAGAAARTASPAVAGSVGSWSPAACGASGQAATAATVA